RRRQAEADDGSGIVEQSGVRGTGEEQCGHADAEAEEDHDGNGGPLGETSDRLEDWRTHCARTTPSDMIHRISLARWTQPVRRTRRGRDLGAASARVGWLRTCGPPGKANGPDLGVRAIRRCCVDHFGLPAAPFSFEPADSLTE